MSKLSPHGVIDHESSDRKTDYLYRISIKGLVRNEAGEVLVVKEAGRDYWDLPGGGIDHSESIKEAIGRELHEEVGLSGDFTYKIIAVDEPTLLRHNFWQIRLIYEIVPNDMTFFAGEDGDEIAFIDPAELQHSDSGVERRVYDYYSLLS